MNPTYATAFIFLIIAPKATTSLGGVVGVLIVAFVASTIMSGFIALVVERIAYRRLIRNRAPSLIMLISAIGASITLSETMGLRDKISGWLGLRDNLHAYVDKPRDIYPMPATINPTNLFKVGDYWVKDIDVVVIVAAIAMMIGLDFFVRKTKFGRGMRAVAQDPESAALMGVNSQRIVELTFLVGGIMAGAAACLYMLRIGVTKPNVGFILGLKAFTAAVMGGIGNLRGALLGGLILGVAENYGSAVFGTQWKDAVAFVLLILILLVRPSGILGEVLGKARA
jgi:branched-chain amino acid transport system permease protein